MKKLIAAILISIALFCIAHKKNDSYVIDRTVMLTGGEGVCSGVQVKAPSGKSYILSANHCESFRLDAVTTEDGKTFPAKILVADRDFDLLLLEGIPSLGKGLPIASTVSPREEIRAFGHGHAYDTYKVEGAIIQNLWKAIEDHQQYVTATTANIFPGMSGGPVVNSDGELVGIADATDGYFGYIVPLQSIKEFLKGY